MELIIISGFLGSGKTTLLLTIARSMVDASKQVAIIENEVGEIGIDGLYLKQEGLEVQELYGGCVCCTLTSDLITTLEKLHSQYNPDIVILEATGVARPGDISSIVQRYRKEMVPKITVVTVLDTVRFEALMEIMEPLITAQIEHGDIVVVNKIDQVADEVVDDMLSSIGQLNPEATLIPISAEKGINLDEITGKLANG